MRKKYIAKTNHFDVAGILYNPATLELEIQFEGGKHFKIKNVSDQSAAKIILSMKDGCHALVDYFCIRLTQSLENCPFVGGVIIVRGSEKLKRELEKRRFIITDNRIFWHIIW